MIRNKRGEGNAIAIFVSLLVLLVVLMGVLPIFFPSAPPILEKLPDNIASVIDGIVKVVKPIFNILYDIIAPVDASPNTQAIAIAMCLLLTLLGYTYLKPILKGEFTSFLVSAIIGVIAARGLTDYVLEQTALSASPIAVTSLIVGFLPILWLTSKIKDWEISHMTAIVIYLIAGVIYALVFSFAFNANTLGIVYGTGIFLVGIGQTVMPYFKSKEKEHENRKTGKFLAWMGENIQTAKQMEEGAKEAKGE